MASGASYFNSLLVLRRKFVHGHPRKNNGCNRRNSGCDNNSELPGTLDSSNRLGSGNKRSYQSSILTRAKQKLVLFGLCFLAFLELAQFGFLEPVLLRRAVNV